MTDCFYFRLKKIVGEKCIVEKKECESKCGSGGDDDEENGSAVQVEEELGAVVGAEDLVDHTLLQLPLDREKGCRLVSGSCAICLESYVVGDEVIWSSNSSCPHVFHSNCIIPWLAKKEEPKCPCCRQSFCEVEPVRAEPRLDTSLSPFGMIPSGFIMRHNVYQNDHELLIIPTNNLIVSETVNDQGTVGLRILERNPPTATDEEVVNTEERSEGLADENTSEMESCNDASDAEETSHDIVGLTDAESTMAEPIIAQGSEIATSDEETRIPEHRVTDNVENGHAREDIENPISTDDCPTCP